MWEFLNIPGSFSHWPYIFVTTLVIIIVAWSSYFRIFVEFDYFPVIANMTSSVKILFNSIRSALFSPRKINKVVHHSSKRQINKATIIVLRNCYKMNPNRRHPLWRGVSGKSFQKILLKGFVKTYQDQLDNRDYQGRQYIMKNTYCCCEIYSRTRISSFCWRIMLISQSC